MYILYFTLLLGLLASLTCSLHVRVQSGSSSNLTVTIQQLRWGPVQIFNTTLTCSAAAGSSPSNTLAATFIAETVQQLLTGIQLMGQLLPSSISLVRDMTVPADTWPKGLLVNQTLYLMGLQPPFRRTMLDLYQVWGLRDGGWGLRAGG